MYMGDSTAYLYVCKLQPCNLWNLLLARNNKHTHTCTHICLHKGKEKIKILQLTPIWSGHGRFKLYSNRDYVLTAGVLLYDLHSTCLFVLIAVLTPRAKESRSIFTKVDHVCLTRELIWIGLNQYLNLLNTKQKS